MQFEVVYIGKENQYQAERLFAECIAEETVGQAPPIYDGLACNLAMLLEEIAGRGNQTVLIGSFESGENGLASIVSGVLGVGTQTGAEGDLAVSLPEGAELVADGTGALVAAHYAYKGRELLLLWDGKWSRQSIGGLLHWEVGGDAPLSGGGAAVLLKDTPKAEIAAKPETLAAQETAEEEPEVFFVKKRSRRGLWAAVTAVAVCLALIGGYFGVTRLAAGPIADSVYAKARTLYNDDAGSALALSTGVPRAFDLLYRQNEDIAGWLTVPDTNIDYPVMYRESDPDFYADHLYTGGGSRYGTPYILSGYKPGDYNFNIVIRGNQTGDGRMFSHLEKYSDLSFYQAVPVITMNTLYGDARWKVFAVCVIPEGQEDGFNGEQTFFFNDEAFAVHLAQLTARSLIETHVDVNVNDELLTLTAPYSGQEGLRFAVVARKVRIGEAAVSETQAAAYRENPLYPNAWYEKNGGTAPDFTLSPSTTQSFLTEEWNSLEAQLPVNETKDLPGQTGEQTTAQATTTTTGSSTAPQPAATAASATQAQATAAKPTQKPAAQPTTQKPTAAKPTEQPAGSGGVLTVKNQSTGQVIKGNAADLVAQIIEAEMGSSFPLEALKAQAVAAYTYLLYQGADEGKAVSAPMRTAGARAIQATNAVIGKTIRYNGALCNAVYSAMTAGKSANAQDVWGGYVPYLTSVDSSVDKNAPSFITTRTYSAAELQRLVKSCYGVDLSGVTDKTKWFQTTYDGTGLYVSKVNLGGKKTVTGIGLRYDMLNASNVGDRSLRSHAYTIQYNSAKDQFTFTVRGYGHGVGLSQRGASAYADKGWDYVQILEHYYKGAKVQ